MKYLIIIVLAVTTLFISALPALANGGVNWRVTVKNPTYMQARVYVQYEKLGVKETDHRIIPAGGSTYWEFGSWCPIYVLGEIKDDFDGVNWVKMNPSTPAGYVNVGVFPDCKNSRLKICRVSGGGPNSHTKVNDYTFCPD